MHILVATDGTLDPVRAADAVARWYQDGDEVIVFTAINVPTHLLSTLADQGVMEASMIALEAGQGFTAGDRAAERLVKPHPTQPDPPRDSPVMHAMATTADARTDSVVRELQDRGIDASSAWATTDNKTARSILSAVRQHDVELLVIGSHGFGRFEGLLGSTGTKLVRLSPASVLIIRDEPEPDLHDEAT